MHTFNDNNSDNHNQHDVRRLIVLLFFLVIAALPLLWLSVDQNAGDKLLQLTKIATR